MMNIDRAERHETNRKVDQGNIPVEAMISERLGVALFSPLVESESETITNLDVLQGRNWRDSTKIGTQIEKRGAFRDILFVTQVHPLSFKSMKKLKERLTETAYAVEEYRKRIEKINTLRRQEPIPKIVESRAYFDDPFLAMLSSTKSTLRSISRRLPQAPQDQDILNALADASVPIMRALWYLKVVFLNRFPLSEAERTEKFTKLVTTQLEAMSKELIDVGITTTNKQRLQYLFKLLFWDLNWGILDRSVVLSTVLRIAENSINDENFGSEADYWTEARIFLTHICTTALTTNTALLLSMPDISMRCLSFLKKALDRHTMKESATAVRSALQSLTRLRDTIKELYVSWDVGEGHDTSHQNISADQTPFCISILLSLQEFSVKGWKEEIHSIAANLDTKTFVAGIMHWILECRSCPLEICEGRLPLALDALEAISTLSKMNGKGNEGEKGMNESGIRRMISKVVIEFFNHGEEVKYAKMPLVFKMLTELEKRNIFDIPTFLRQCIARGTLDDPSTLAFTEFLYLYASQAGDEESALQLRSAAKITPSIEAPFIEFADAIDALVIRLSEDSFSADPDAMLNQECFSKVAAGVKSTYRACVLGKASQALLLRVKKIQSRLRGEVGTKRRKIEQETGTLAEETTEHILSAEMRIEIESLIIQAMEEGRLLSSEKLRLVRLANTFSLQVLNIQATELHVCEECKEQGTILLSTVLSLLRKVVPSSFGPLVSTSTSNSDRTIGESLVDQLEITVGILNDCEISSFVKNDASDLLELLQRFMNGVNSRSFLSSNCIPELWLEYTKRCSESLILARYSSPTTVTLSDLSRLLEKAENLDDVEDALMYALDKRVRGNNTTSLDLGIDELYTHSLCDILFAIILSVPIRRGRTVWGLIASIRPHFARSLSLHRLVYIFFGHFFFQREFSRLPQRVDKSKLAERLVELTSGRAIVPSELLLTTVILAIRNYSVVNIPLVRFTCTLLNLIALSSESYLCRKLVFYVIYELASIALSDEGLDKEITLEAGRKVSSLVLGGKNLNDSVLVEGICDFCTLYSFGNMESNFESDLRKLKAVLCDYVGNPTHVETTVRFLGSSTGGEVVLYALCLAEWNQPKEVLESVCGDETNSLERLLLLHRLLGKEVGQKLLASGIECLKNRAGKKDSGQDLVAEFVSTTFSRQISQDVDALQSGFHDLLRMLESYVAVGPPTPEDPRFSRLLSLLRVVMKTMPLFTSKLDFERNSKLFERYVIVYLNLMGTAPAYCVKDIRMGILHALNTFITTMREKLKLSGHHDLIRRLEQIMSREISRMNLSMSHRIQLASVLGSISQSVALIPPSSSQAVLVSPVDSLAGRGIQYETAHAPTEPLQTANVDPWKLLEDYANGQLYPSIFISSSFSTNSTRKRPNE